MKRTKELRNIIKLRILIAIEIFLIFLIIPLYYYRDYIEDTYTTILVGVIIILFINILSIIIPLLLDRWIKKKSKMKVRDLQREVNEKYTPAIASFLLDNYIEDEKDILATILDLSVRDYLKIDIDEELNILIDYKKFSYLVIKDCLKEELITGNANMEKKYVSIILLIFYCLLIRCILSFGIFNVMVLYGVMKVLISRMTYHKRTQKGKKLAEEFMGFKEYLKEYTLIKTRDVEYIEILDRYLTFALALEEADTIEKKYVPYNKLIKKYIQEK